MQASLPIIDFYEYKFVDIRTVKGIRYAERLHNSEEWEQCEHALDMIVYRRKRKPKKDRKRKAND